MSEVFKRNKKHNKRQSAGTSRKKGNQDNEINDLQTIASSSGGNIALIPNSGQSITLHEFFISKGKCFFLFNYIFIEILSSYFALRISKITYALLANHTITTSLA